ncbi:cysteine hydrolase family protein [Chloroflexota bacterium]
MAERVSLDLSKTVVLIMDYQNRQLSAFTEDFQRELMARANEVLAGARHGGIPVIYVEVRRGEKTPETEIHPAVNPQPGELVLTKRRTGPFSTTNLDEVLKKKGIETLVLMGIATGGCVLSTVRWAADIDYRLIVLSDCCADRDEEIQRVLMEKVLPRHANVVTSQEFLQAVGDARG